MPRFHFHIHNDAEFVPDDEGMSFPTTEAAKQEAIASIRELVADRLKANQPLGVLKIEIADSTGAMIEIVQVNDAVR